MACLQTFASFSVSNVEDRSLLGMCSISGSVHIDVNRNYCSCPLGCMHLSNKVTCISKLALCTVCGPLIWSSLNDCWCQTILFSGLLLQC